jgi:hypothetical protein
MSRSRPWRIGLETIRRVQHVRRNTWQWGEVGQMETWVIVLLVVILLGGGGWGYSRWR